MHVLVALASSKAALAVARHAPGAAVRYTSAAVAPQPWLRARQPALTVGVATTAATTATMPVIAGVLTTALVPLLAILPRHPLSETIANDLETFLTELKDVGGGLISAIVGSVMTFFLAVVFSPMILNFASRVIFVSKFLMSLLRGLIPAVVLPVSLAQVAGFHFAPQTWLRCMQALGHMCAAASVAMLLVTSVRHLRRGE